MPGTPGTLSLLSPAKDWTSITLFASTPNLLFISWQHYIPKYQRQNFKKKYGYSIDGFGNQVQDKKKDTKNVDPTNMNALFARKQNVPTTVKKKDDKKYNQVSEYKPTGNLIYNTALLKKIENPNSNK